MCISYGRLSENIESLSRENIGCNSCELLIDHEDGAQRTMTGLGLSFDAGADVWSCRPPSSRAALARFDIDVLFRHYG